MLVNRLCMVDSIVINIQLAIDGFGENICFFAPILFSYPTETIHLI
jgi:hypothetical protein